MNTCLHDVGGCFSVEKEGIPLRNSKGKKNHRRNPGTWVSAISAAYLCIALAAGAYADGFGGGLVSAGEILQRLALCGGALGIAFSGIELACGNEQTASRAKTRIFLIAAATACVLMIPYVVRLGQSLASGSAWSPDSLGTH